MTDAATDPAMETAQKWALQYAASCKETLSAANTCLKVANLAVGARNMANQRPQAEISIRTFANKAQEEERKFVPLFRSFVEACDSTRSTAESLLSAQTEHEPEIVLGLNVDPATLNDIATVKAILLADLGSTPAEFVAGIEQANAMLNDPFPEGGNIYAPPPPTEQECPWCAETIKAAAVVCRYCGRDVQVGSGTEPSD